MSNFAEQDARAILEKVVASSKADECTARLAGAINGNIRFALNNVSTSGMVSDASLEVQVAFGKRVGIATINEFDDASLSARVRRAEELARLAPENAEFMPALEKQSYKPTPDLRRECRGDHAGVPRHGRGPVHRAMPRGQAGRGRLPDR